MCCLCKRTALIFCSPWISRREYHWLFTNQSHPSPAPTERMTVYELSHYPWPCRAINNQRWTVERDLWSILATTPRTAACMTDTHTHLLTIRMDWSGHYSQWLALTNSNNRRGTLCLLRHRQTRQLCRLNYATRYFRFSTCNVNVLISRGHTSCCEAKKLAWQCSTVGDRAFAVAGARLWNSLPHDIVASDTLSHFRCGLKTFLFRQSYPSILF